MIYVTGDCHGIFHRLSFKNWPLSRQLSKEDCVIVAGDCGLIFHPAQTPDEIWWTKWLKTRPFEIYYIDGNHDNHWLLNELPREQRFGGMVGKIADNIYHLRRGEIYEIQGKKILTFGGATSIDKNRRVAGVSWWPEEVPNYGDMDHCLDSMEKHNYRVDYVIAHTCPQALAPVIAGRGGFIPHDDPTQRMLDHITMACKFDHFFCGHFHEDVNYGKFHFLYNQIINTGELDSGLVERGVLCD